MKRLPAVATQLQRCTPTRGALAWLLMLAMLFGQGLGAVHSISHGVPGSGTHAHAQTHGPACENGEALGLQALFSHAPDAPGCRLYDQLLQAGPLMPVAIELAAPALARTVPPPDAGVRLAAPAAAYQARGPPRG